MEKTFLISQLKVVCEHMITFEKFQNVLSTGCLSDYNYFNNYLAIDLRKEQALDPKAIRQINFTGNLDQAAGAIMFFITEKMKETISDFSQGTVKVLLMCSIILFCSNIISI